MDTKKQVRQNPHRKRSPNQVVVLIGPRAKRNKARTTTRPQNARSTKGKNTCNKETKTRLQNGQTKPRKEGKKHNQQCQSQEIIYTKLSLHHSKATATKRRTAEETTR